MGRLQAHVDRLIAPHAPSIWARLARLQERPFLRQVKL
jgi:hypothetical protein